MLSRDPEQAGQAIWAMVDTPAPTLKLLRQRLHPVMGSAAAINNWITELDAQKFAVRDQATRELSNLGPAAREALTRKLNDQPPLEVLRRIEKLLADLKVVPPPPEQMRMIRAVEILEHIGTADARQFLQELAAGADGANFDEPRQGSDRAVEPARAVGLTQAKRHYHTRARSRLEIGVAGFCPTKYMLTNAASTGNFGPETRA